MKDVQEIVIDRFVMIGGQMNEPGQFALNFL